MDIKHGLSHGNLVLDHEGNVDIVVGYLGRIVHLVNYGPIDVQNVDAIIITEEWLLKAGFEKKNIHKDPRMFVWVINDIALVAQIDSLFYMRGFSEIEIKYVHQLQNLYFALTGEELIFKA